MASKALALDPNYAGAHNAKAGIVSLQGRHDEAIAENERALALDPARLYGDRTIEGLRKAGLPEE